MRKDAAEKILGVALESSRRTEESIRRVAESCSEEVSQSYRRRAGRIMGYLFTEILAPLWNEHPDLVPAWYREQQREAASDSKPKISKDMLDHLLALLHDIEATIGGTVDIADQACAEDAALRFRGGIREILEQVAATRGYLTSLDVDSETCSSGRADD